jgi:hypothetical protein
MRPLAGREVRSVIEFIVSDDMKWRESGQPSGRFDGMSRRRLTVDLKEPWLFLLVLAEFEFVDIVLQA